MSIRMRSWLWRYSVALLTVTLTLLLKLSIDSLIKVDSPFGLFLVPIMMSAWYGGRGQGLLAIALATLVTNYFFLPPTYTLIISSLQESLQLTLFMVEGVVITLLITTLRSAKGHTEISKLETQNHLENLRQSQATLRESDERFRFLVEGIKDYALFMLDTEGRVAGWNAGAERIKGYQAQEIIGKHFSCFYTAKDIELGLPERILEQATVEGQFEEEGWLVRKDGSQFWANVIVTALRDEAGNLQGFSNMTRDITERKRSSEALQVSEARYRTMIDQSPLSIQVLSPQGRTLQVNRAWEELWNLRLEEISNYNLLEDEQLVAKGVMPYIQRGFAGEATAIPPILYQPKQALPSGRDRWVRAFIYPVKDDVGHIGEVVLIHEDITNSKRAEEALQESEERFRVMANTAPVMIWMSGLDKLCYYFNKGWLDFTGRTLEQEMGNGWGEGVHPEDFQRFLDTYNTAFDARQEFQMEYRLRRFDGEYRWILDTGIPRFTPDGSFVGYISSGIDITERKQSEEEIAKLNQNLQRLLTESQTLLEVIPIGIGIAEDPECKSIRVNPAFAQQLGISPEVNASLSAPEDEKPSNFKIYRDGRELAPEELPMQYCAAMGVEVLDMEVDVVHEDGKIVKLLEYAAPLFDEDGKTRGCIGAFLDITERKRVEETLRFLAEASTRLGASLDYETTLDSLARLAVTSLADLCVVDIVEEDGTIRRVAVAHVDPAMEELARELLQCNPPDADRSHPVMKVLRTGKPELVGEVSDSLLVSVTGNVEHLHIVRELGYKSFITVPLLTRERTLGTISLVLTKSGRRYNSTDLALAEELARRAALAIDNARLYRVSEADRRAAQEASRLKDEFLAALSHELRTPLNSVLGWTTLLRSRKFDEAKTALALETMERNAKSLKVLIEDILDVSRIIKGKLCLNVATCALESVIEGAIASMRLAAQAKAIRIESFLDSSAGLVWGDANRLQQVVWNLLSNAIKFTPKGGRVEVRLERINSHVQIRVSDTGKGISPDFLPYVFDRFRQADGSTTRLDGGLGLGLATVRHLVELHGGIVKAESPGEGQGATFTVELPLRAVCTQARASKLDSSTLGSTVPLDSARVLDGLQVLVVDDETDTRELLSIILKQYGAKVTAAASAAEALLSLEQSKPDVLVSDIGMPGEDGYALIRAYRAREAERGGHLPAVALTAYATESDRQQALEAGFQMHVPKPVELHQLVEVVAHLARCY